MSALFAQSPLFGVAIYLVGLYGLTSNKRNLIVLLVSAEVIVLGIVMCFSWLSALYQHPLWDSYALVVAAVAAAESALGLSLTLLWYKAHGDIRLRRQPWLRS